MLDSASQRIVVIISADLAHTHQASGPYGYSNASEPFDLACGHWATTLDKSTLTVTAAGYADRALSCGFTGFVMLHGMLERAAQGTAEWLSTLLANYHPSYYGMMVASFVRQTFQVYRD
ncbi:hypothetical protein V1264_002079 [Littorina saxatilis]|uniref:Uncharacterized protein n=1 Tax=Littorina saxatilis TaxID=31220 RepID=A0AAN9C2U5_9CAEN